MSVRRLAPTEIQPPSFAFSAENAVWAGSQIAKYPDGRQASAVIPLLWRAQHQAGGWVPQKAIEHVAEVLGMAYIRVLEIATFYTMFNLAPVGRHFVQLCGTTPCMLRGAQELRKQLIARIGPEKTVSADGQFSWAEVECLGACCNAPMVQINDDFYEDLTPESLNKLLDDLAAGRPVKIGPQNGRVSSEPEGAITTLTDSSLYDGSVVGAWRARFEQEEKAKADAAAAAAAAQADAAKAQPAATPASAAAQPAATAPAAAAAAQTPEPAKPASTRPEQKASDSPAARVAEGQSPTAPAAAHAASAATPPDQQERARAGAPGTSGAAASPGGPATGQPPSSQSGAAAGGGGTAGTAGAQATPSSAAANAGASSAAPAPAQSGSASAQAAPSTGAASAASAGSAAPASSSSATATANASATGATASAAAASPASVRPSVAGTTRQAVGVGGIPSGPAGQSSFSQTVAGGAPAGAESARSTATRAVAYVNWEPEFTGPAMRLSSAGGEHIAGEAFASPQGIAARPAADGSVRTTLWSPVGVPHWQPAFVGGATAPLLGALVSDEHKPELLDGPRGDGPDDLKLIWGVGPKLEAMLHRLGVFHFDQIAVWTEPNLHWVDQHLEAFKGRAVREQWVEQAKKLATGWRPQSDIGDKPKG